VRLVSYRGEADAGARLGAALGEAGVVDLRAALAEAFAAAGEPDRSAEAMPSDMTAFLALGEGALAAARWLASAPPGAVYTMHDVLAGGAR